MRDMADSVVPPQPRDYHGWNWSGFFTLYQREIRRFWKVGTQTVAAPVVTTLLYMLVFVVAVGPARQAVDGTSASAISWPRA
jgi:ABC-2 type transport system permease protein